MFHLYKNNGSDKTLVLFHGTGGDENSLIDLARQVAPSMNYLALRGEVVSFGMRRFAKTNHENEVIDVDDMLSRVEGILKMIRALKTRYGLGELWALGFSNGANALEAILLDGDVIFNKVILMRPMNLNTQTKELPLNNLEILIHSGKRDDIIPYESAIDLEKRLIKNGGNVTHKIFDVDHWMRVREVNELKTWFDERL